MASFSVSFNLEAEYQVEGKNMEMTTLFKESEHVLTCDAATGN